MSAADSLNPKQHHEYFYTKDSDQGYGEQESTEYKAIRRTLHETGEIEHHQVGMLEVVHNPRSPEVIGKSPAQRGMDYDENWLSSWNPRRTTPVGGMVQRRDEHGVDYMAPLGYQGRLFEYTPPKPAYDSVDNLAGTKEHRVQNMTMLGMAQNASREEGVELRPSSDLSEHSSKLVGHLKGKGVVPESASTQITNDLQFHKPYKVHDPMYGGVQRVHQEEVEAGRQTLRQTLRGSRDDGKRREIPGQGKLEL